MYTDTMSARALSTSTHHKGYPLLEALKHVTYGRLTMMTPEGTRLEFGGSKEGPNAYLCLYDWDVIDELSMRGEIGFAETYLDEKWETTDLPALLTFALLNAPSLEHFFYGRPWHAIWLRIRRLFNPNSLHNSRQNIMAHYDVGNNFYSLWLDRSMTYSCALFEGDTTRTLEEAQLLKHRRILRKIAAKPGEHILEIGCGWGAFAEMAAHEGLRVTGVTLSEKQAEYARERIERSGLSHLVSIQLKDYREITGQYDHIVSIGMFEHVGQRYWPVYFDTLDQRLKQGGKALIQSIITDDELFERNHAYSGFIDQYIFPGGIAPSKARFVAGATKFGLAAQEIYEFGSDYAITLRHWLARFEAQRSKVKAMGYDEIFIRLWRFYLASCIASFASKRTSVMQALLTHA